MNSDSELQNKATTIYQSLEELHALLSALQEQTRLGLFTAQPDIEQVEVPMPKNLAPDLEEWFL